MSSHHVVRDEQEPALVIADPEALSPEARGSVLEWSPTIVVLSPVLDTVLRWGIKLDVVVGYENELDYLREVLQPQSPVQVLVIPEGGDLLATGLVYLQQNRYPAVNVLADLHHQGLKTFTTLQEFVGALDVVTYSHGWKCWPAKGHRLEKWLPKGQVLELLPLQPNLRLRTQGLFPEFANERWEGPFQARVEADGKVKAEANGPFWVYEKLD